MIVAVAPRSVRLYSDYFSVPVEPPHFIEYAMGLAVSHGFSTVDLYTALAEQDYLTYFRDDDHWNQNGQSVAAENIATYISSSSKFD